MLLEDVPNDDYRKAKRILHDETGCTEPLRSGLMASAPFLPHEYAQAAVTLHKHGEDELRRQINERFR